ncbi:MAG: hypothetical protein K8F51_02125 [Comamonas sp.]|nr:hypothetical protein [Comamonas sp.]
MIRINTTLSAIAAALLLSGTAFATDLQPAAGEAPFALSQATPGTSMVKRADVRTAAASQAPVAGNLPAAQPTFEPGTLTRAQVREATRDAIAHGYRVASGDLS